MTTTTSATPLDGMAMAIEWAAEICTDLTQLEACGVAEDFFRDLSGYDTTPDIIDGAMTLAECIQYALLANGYNESDPFPVNDWSLMDVADYVLQVAEAEGYTVKEAS